MFSICMKLPLKCFQDIIKDLRAPVPSKMWDSNTIQESYNTVEPRSKKRQLLIPVYEF